MSKLIPQGKHKYAFLALILAGVALIGAGFVLQDYDPPAPTEKISPEQTWEARIEELCLSVSGIDYAKAFVTLDGTLPEASGGDDASPCIRGVAVTVTGGDSPAVQKRVVELVSSALGISSARVAVAEAKKQ